MYGCRVRRVYEPDLAVLKPIIAAPYDAAVSRERPTEVSDCRQRFLPEMNS